MIGDICVISAACDDSWVISAMGDGKCSTVWSNSLCGARVNEMEGRPLMASEQKPMNRIRDILLNESFTLTETA